MTSRMLAPHTTCPGCQEEVFLDELVRGRCPLCGCTLEDFADQTGDMDEMVERSDFSWLVFNYFLFKKFDEMGANPLQVMQLIAGLDECCLNPVAGEFPRTKFEFDIPMNLGDRIRPKKCTRCGKVFFRGGRKVLSGDLASPELKINYICSRNH